VRRIATAGAREVAGVVFTLAVMISIPLLIVAVLRALGAS
jgi:hypothetical protein